MTAPTSPPAPDRHRRSWIRPPGSVRRGLVVIAVLVAGLAVPVGPAAAATAMNLQDPSRLTFNGKVYRLSGSCPMGGPTMSVELTGTSAKATAVTANQPFKFGNTWFVTEVSLDFALLGTSVGANESYTVGADPGAGDDMKIHLLLAFYERSSEPCGQGDLKCRLKVELSSTGTYTGSPNAPAAGAELSVNGDANATFAEFTVGSCQAPQVLKDLIGKKVAANLTAVKP